MLAGGDLRQKAPLLLVVAADHDRQHAEFLHRNDQRTRGTRFRDLLDHLHVGNKTSAEAAVFGGNRYTEEIVLREETTDIVGELLAFVDRCRARRDFFGYEFAHHLDDHRFFVVRLRRY